MSHYNRPVKQGIELALVQREDKYGYPIGAPTIHARGCSHTLGKAVYNSMDFEYATFDPYADDWYEVAPCAADGKGLVCTTPGCHIG